MEPEPPEAVAVNALGCPTSKENGPAGAILTVGAAFTVTTTAGDLIEVTPELSVTVAVTKFKPEEAAE